ncbi:MAG TPA: ornithine cyclodeaminase family protein [Actinomycetota bacterium]|nr:ornithine cyclodeaminase family protein [Actinomycetota bacterium]
MAGTVRVLREAEVRAALDMAACIEVLAPAFAAYTTGAAELPSVIHLDVPEARGEVHVKAGHLHGAPTYAVKVASGFSAQEPPAIDGMVVVFDARTGAPVALLLDGGYLTDLRTGAAGGVAARHLAPTRVATVAVVGTGAQARKQIEALAVVRPGVAEVRVWGRHEDRAAAAASDIGTILPGASVDVAESPDAAVVGADVVITCTAAREPLVRGDWIGSGVHVTAVGSDGEGKQELDPALLRKADLLVVDSRVQAERLGELQHAPDLADRAVELGEICAGTTEGRSDQRQITVCDLTGVGVQDVAAANAVLANVGDRGQILEL